MAQEITIIVLLVLAGTTFVLAWIMFISQAEFLCANAGVKFTLWNLLTYKPEGSRLGQFLFMLEAATPIKLQKAKKPEIEKLRKTAVNITRYALASAILMFALPIVVFIVLQQ